MSFSDVRVTRADGSTETVPAARYRRRRRWGSQFKWKRPKRKDAYGQYLRSERWAKTRSAILWRDRYECQDCGSSKRLMVHHLTYMRVGRELPEDLVTLCQPCHAKRHGKDS